MTKGARIGKLMGVLTVAFAMCHRWGEKLEAKSGVEIKNHGYRVKILFRRGFESLHTILDNSSHYVAGTSLSRISHRGASTAGCRACKALVAKLMHHTQQPNGR